MDEEIASTKRFFQAHHIGLSDFWLESCIQWYREEHPDLNYTLETLHLKVYEQWLLLDLRDVELPILPANLAQQKKVVLNGIYSLQMLHIIDISRSKYCQIQKLRNANALINSINEQEYQTVNHGKRALQLLLTDGVQKVEAVEYKPINVLNINLAPGTKIKITGPVTIRRGQMMLEEKHVNVLGGEVEELLVSNAAENILANALNLPLNPNPNVIKEDSVADNTNVLRNVQNPTNNQSGQTNLVPTRLQTNHQPISIRNVENIANNRSQNQNNNLIANNSINKSIPENKSLQQRNVNNKNDEKLGNMGVGSNINTNFISADEEMHILQELDMLLETEREMNIDNPSVFEDRFLDTDTILKIGSPNTKKRKCSNDTKNTSKDSDKSLFEDMDVDAHLDVIDEKIKTTNQITKKQIGIAELLSNNITSGKFRIKARFKSVIQKLTVTNDAWSLKILITDDKSDMAVSVHSDVISDLMGYYPAAVMALKKDILNKDEHATTKVMKIIEGLKAKIMNLDCLMEVTFAPDQNCPTITNLK